MLPREFLDKFSLRPPLRGSGSERVSGVRAIKPDVHVHYWGTRFEKRTMLEAKKTVPEEVPFNL